MRGMTDDERALLTHWSLWGSAGYPIEKRGRHWWWREWRTIKGSPLPYKTQRAAEHAFEAYIDILIAAKAGRL